MSDVFFSVFLCFSVLCVVGIQRVQNTQIECTLPPHPKNGKWSILNGHGTPGDKISDSSILRFECDSGYKLSLHTDWLVCDQNWNLPKEPLCEKKCSPKYSTATTTFRCEDKLGRKVECDEATDGTLLTYNCTSHYETPPENKKAILCVDGIWEANPICQPVCGQKVDKDTIQLIIGGDIKGVNEYPWVTAIFRKLDAEFENICGGTLVSQNVVITAAHCVTNNYGDALSPEKFIIGAGKHYSKFQHPRDLNAQYVEVVQIIVKMGYRGASQRYLADIALLVSKESITVNDVVQPVCYRNLPSIHLQAGKIGIVAGWGKTDTTEQSDELRTLEIPYKHQTICSQELPSQWADKFLTIDKICAGFVNRSKSLCTGDSGSGFYFQNPEDNKYYIHGVVSVAPADNGECNPDQNALYTDVSYYYEFVHREIIKQYKEQCPLPLDPSNGKWIYQKKKFQVVVSSNTVFKVECNQGYELSFNNASIDCKSTANIRPKCELFCPRLNFPQGTNYKCINKQENEIDCTKAIHGTRLNFSCPHGYQPSTEGHVFCKMGSWGEHQPECVSNENIASEERKVICTYASWYAYEGVYPEEFNVTLCTHIVYAYIGIWEKGDVRVQDESLELDANQKGLYRRVTDLKQRNRNLKILLSIGGTAISNSSLFSSVANHEGKKAALIYSAIYFIATYNFDGVDIAWNHPEPHDKVAYINLLRDFRKKCNEKGYILTATVRADPENTGYDGNEMNGLLDWVTVNSFDFYGPWNNRTGHISALYPSSQENEWEKSHLSIEGAANNWMRLGVSKSKMVLSTVFYGWLLTLSDSDVNGIHAPVKVTSSAGDYKLLRYSQICTNKNWISVWDDEQKSVYSYYGDKWIGHENNNSVWIKATYIKKNGFLGVNIWPIDGDDVHGKCGSKQLLLKQINKGLKTD